MSDERRHEWRYCEFTAYVSRRADGAVGMGLVEYPPGAPPSGSICEEILRLATEVSELVSALATSEAARKVAEAERLTLAKVLLWNDCSECDEPGRPCGHEGAASFMVTYNQAVKLAARVSKGEEHGS